jgi:hypothetical protein
MSKCKLCNSSQREEIERKIAARELTQVQAAAIIKSTPSAISRHMRNCFPKKVAEWVKPEATKQETLNVVNELLCSHKKLLELYEQAKAVGNIDAAIRALGEERRHIELFAKLTGQLNEPQAQIDILVNPELVRMEQAIIKFVDPEKRVEFSEWLMDDSNHN